MLSRLLWAARAVYLRTARGDMLDMSAIAGAPLPHILYHAAWRPLAHAQFLRVLCPSAVPAIFLCAHAQFLHNVSINLKEGGYFIGTVPDGKRINECIKT